MISLFRFARSSRKLLKYGIGAGVLGAGLIALRQALKPAPKAPLPDAISPAIFATRVFQTSLGQIVYHESGSGDPLVFIHGVCLGASSFIWSKVYQDFAAGHRVFAPDLLGFGESERPDKPLTAADHVRVLADFLRGVCGKRRAILVGNDIGAGFCALLATQHPELVQRLVLVMPTGLSELGQMRLPIGMYVASRIKGVKDFLYRNYFARRPSVKSWLTDFGFGDPAKVTDDIVDIFTQCAQQAGAGHAIMNFLAGRLAFDLESRLGSITQPVTLIWGGRTHFPPPEWGERIRASIPSANLVVIDNAGFLAPLEEPAAVSEILANELDGGLRVIGAS